LTTKKADFAGAATTPTRSLPDGAASSRRELVGLPEDKSLSASVAKTSAEMNGKSFIAPSFEQSD
jgi:hypothetical protein